MHAGDEGKGCLVSQLTGLGLQRDGGWSHATSASQGGTEGGLWKEGHSGR